ncbi:uncharacterized protein EDB91DRAFT_1139935 [Suillus paluster]|uniref:uncharacterized protein n=1 Tax=Suillus paluster TaxID=48578 RepID=UPI001B872FAB|nr:uncharacterized protein EDB91DRAFT_1139935 [Suillus paluster]KAG1737468.1 hypothetical protein EDB91DRAFT_1139935 [Suillus paluster]
MCAKYYTRENRSGAGTRRPALGLAIIWLTFLFNISAQTSDPSSGRRGANTRVIELCLTVAISEQGIQVATYFPISQVRCFGSSRG